MIIDNENEAVYNKNGVLLTEKNDPVNMGTFNFAAGIVEEYAHFKYDVNTYFKWGNSQNSPQKGKLKIQNGVNKAIKAYNKNISKVKLFRKKIIGVGMH